MSGPARPGDSPAAAPSLAGQTVDVAVVDVTSMSFPAWEKLTEPPRPEAPAGVLEESARAWREAGRGHAGALIAGGPVTRHELRAASVLKPLYAYAALAGQAEVPDVVRNRRRPTLMSWVEQAICVSDNDATDRLVAATLNGADTGLEAVLGRVHAATGVRFEPGPTWGQVPVRARDVAGAYAALVAQAGLSDGDLGKLVEPARSYATAAGAVLDLMSQVPRVQRLGVDRAWVRHVPGAPGGVGVKVGWDLDPDGALRTNVVLVDRRAAEQPVVVCLLVASVVSGAFASQWRRVLHDEGAPGVLELHADVHGPGLVLGMSVAQRLHAGLGVGEN